MEIPAERLAAVKRAFAENFESRGELGASVCVMQRGQVLLELARGEVSKGGPAWTAETIVPVYSATKAVAAITLLHLLAQRGLTPELVVREVWPEFPVEGATVAQMLSHQCGLPALDIAADVGDYSAVIAAIEAQKPAWELGTAHGYHPRIYGYLVDEVVARIDGRRCGELWNEGLRAELDCDFWIGLPESEDHRVATLYPGRMEQVDPAEAPFYQDFGTRGTLTSGAFLSPRGLNSVAEVNASSARRLALPAMGGIGTARALAEIYQAVLRADVIAPQVQDWLAQRQTMGDDLVLKRPTSFGMGVMLDPLDGAGRKMRHIFGASRFAFGHPGAGGSHAFVDPATGVSFAYVMNQMELSVMPGEKSLSMVRALGV